MSGLIDPDSVQGSEVDFFGMSIEHQEIINELKQDVGLKEICQRILEKKVIDQAAQERGVTVEVEEIQEEADRVRREMHLERAADTLAWLSGHLLTPEDWEEGIRDRLLRNKLTEVLFASEVERFFAQNRVNFERAVLYQIVVPYPQLAQEIYYQIEEAEISFYEAAHLYDVDSNRRHCCGYVGTVHRWDLHPDLAACVFSATPGDVIGPIAIEDQYFILRVEEFVPAELTQEVRQNILTKLFEEWLQGEVNYQFHQ